MADRIIAVAEIIGQENVIAGTGCDRVHPQIACGKLAPCSTALSKAKTESRSVKIQGLTPDSGSARIRGSSGADGAGSDQGNLLIQ